jgi:SAM-dependent methyltransferase
VLAERRAADAIRSVRGSRETRATARVEPGTIAGARPSAGWRRCARQPADPPGERALGRIAIAARPTPDPVRLFSDRSQAYVRFIRAVGYPQGIRAFFLRSPLLRSGLRVLDAGCGTGVVAIALRDALLRRGLAPGPTQAFDLTPAMLGHFRRELARRAITDIELAEADVLALDRLPASWRDYDLVVSASMLEYLPPARLGAALRGLRSLLREDGVLVLFITRRNWLTRPLIGRWWRSSLYGDADLDRAFRQAGFASIAFRSFPPRYRHLGLWGRIVEARQQRRAALLATGYAGAVVSDLWVRIRLRTQRLEVLEGARAIANYPVSTSAKGAGERAGSEQTPRGAHEVRELIGEGAPSGAVFVGRCPTGETCTSELRAANPHRDWILSRVIWLSGLDAGRNAGGEVDTYARYIYIHGTPDDEPIGEPRSHGCIRMRNADVIELFDRLEIGTLVRIEE